MVRGKIIALSDYVGKEKSFQINNLNFQFMKLEKEGREKETQSRRKGIIAEITEIENRKAINTVKPKAIFFHEK